MMRKDVNKPKGKTSAYAFFVQTCREEHRKKNPEQSVNFAEFSKKCSERWKVRGQGLGAHFGQVGRAQRNYWCRVDSLVASSLPSYGDNLDQSLSNLLTSCHLLSAFK